ncbi:DNA repair protein RadC [Rhizobium sp. N122]|nr:DNA repair protein RadC [Rhizobium sp. N122]
MVIIDAANALAIIVHDHIIIGKNGDVGLKGLTLIKHRSG